MRKLPDFLLLIIAGVSCCGAVAIGGIVVSRWDLARCYDIPPWEFERQCRLIQPGLTEKEAIAKIAVYNEIKREDGRTLVILRAKKKASMGIAINQGVTLELNTSGIVERVETWDGGPGTWPRR